MEEIPEDTIFIGGLNYPEEMTKDAYREDEWMEGLYLKKPGSLTRGEYFFVDNEGRLVSWTTEKGEEVRFFNEGPFNPPCDLGPFVGINSFEIREDFTEEWRVFDKETHRAVPLITETGEKVYTFNKLHDCGNLIYALCGDQARFFEKETRRAKKWTTEKGEDFYAFSKEQRPYDFLGDLIGIVHQKLFIFFRRDSGAAEYITLENGEKHFIFPFGFCVDEPSVAIIQAQDKRWRIIDLAERKVIGWTTFEGKVVYAIRALGQFTVIGSMSRVSIRINDEVRYFSLDTRQEVEADRG